MKYSIKAGSPEKISTDCVAVVVWTKGALSDEASIIDSAGSKCISKITRAGDLTGKLGETQIIHNPAGVQARRVLLVGGGERKKLTAKNAAKLLQSSLKAAGKLQAAKLHFALGSLAVTDRDANWLVARLAQETETCSYRYDTTKSKKPKPVATKTVSLAPAAGARRNSLQAALKAGQVVGKAINRARQLGNLPGNICTPTFLAKQASTLAERHRSITTKLLSETQMARLGMGSLLSVSAGSAEPAKLIVIQHKGAKADSRPHVLVGKGITFDTGGISLKPGGAMDEMKFDMCGAASVIATMGCVAELKLPINIVGVVATAENMPGSRATKPGDIVTSMSGKTIEILNTDAEGRLVLCDALSYAERFKPRSLIDIATLTGAAVATFGSHANALLSNDDKFAAALLDCGEQSLDRAWQLPLWEEYQSLLNSNFADIANIGGPRAGTITAACFLSRFTEKQKWAHLDIAGSAWHSGAQKGATGRPVGLLVEYLSRQKA
ncbi:MAG: leucyl aminopeptidase [Gammaproteobacteria bacterium]|jgi:leucyl aminopeptidase|nr:leucyl aminopeptidase [Gammaproteobacteria bacterium]HJN96926.1 leucyl aminopeptidase [Gammaproteobacteria bacterium]|tara:strand:+ start:16456 stop:17943 length:1488 start_codon:yes stop_codon:yes gene_type:complete